MGGPPMRSFGSCERQRVEYAPRKPVHSLALAATRYRWHARGVHGLNTPTIYGGAHSGHNSRGFLRHRSRSRRAVSESKKRNPFAGALTATKRQEYERRAMSQFPNAAAGAL